MATAVYENLVGKCLDKVIKEISYVWDYQGLVDKLESDSGKLEIRLSDVQREVSNAMYQGRGIKKEVTKWIQDAGKEQKEVAESLTPGCCTHDCNCWHRYTAAKTAETHSKEITKLLVLLPQPWYFDPTNPPSLASYLEDDYVAWDSREKDLQTLKHALLEKYLVIGIYGVGGVGKTTLAKKLAADMERGGKFDVVAVVTRWKKDGVPDIQQQIAEWIGFDLQVKTVVDRAGRLRDKLSGMGKVLIILDNVAEEMNLSELGIPRPVAGQNVNVCRIVVVSRSVNVCKAMGSHMNLEVHPLTAKEPLVLLNNYFAKEYNLTGDSIQNARGHLSRKTAWLPADIKAHIRTSLLRLKATDPNIASSSPGGNRTFWLDAGALRIEHVENVKFWRLESRKEVILIEVCYLHIEGKARGMSPNTNYGVYFVYKLSPNAKGFNTNPLEMIVGRTTKSCHLDTSVVHCVATRRKGEDWLEIQMGSFYNDGFSNAEVDLVVRDHSIRVLKSGLRIRGIELRPLDPN